MTDPGSTDPKITASAHSRSGHDEFFPACRCELNGQVRRFIDKTVAYESRYLATAAAQELLQKPEVVENVRALFQNSTDE